ncbi:MAG: ATP-binding protein [Phocaeicola sp.]|uniref:ATP-binding protein n=1 Tax=Phocaeicola sp. TaxID=2773926 RepID=UPI003F9FCC70
MEREILKELIAWKSRPDRKPLILLGARQVGKTHILKEFGRSHYKYLAYVNCDNNEMVADLFTSDYNMERILLSIGALTNVPIEPGNTLIVLDEIQELHRGLASLKYFCEDAREYHVAVAGSSLGIALHQGESYPVGKVNTMHMHPMNFEEFVLAKGKRQLLDVLRTCDWTVMQRLRSQYIQLLREYYFVGGMPEAVQRYIDTNDAVKVREVQHEILLAYDKDVSKHTPTSEAIRISQVWHSIPSQLAKENRKFIYGVVRKGARAKDFEIAIQWLIDAGLVYKIPRVTTPSMPLSVYEDFAAFKLYMLDCGLLGAMSNTPAALLLMPNNMKESKGAFTESFVCSQMQFLQDATIGYYSKENSKQEIDFLLQQDINILPIEVKAEENLRAKSMQTFLSEHAGLHGLRFSMTDYREQEHITNIPLYATLSYLRASATNDK